MPVTTRDRLPKVGIHPADDPLRGYGKPSAGRSAEGRGEVPVPLRATDIRVAVSGGLATVTATRTFRNDEAASIEATLTLPVPTDAVTHGLRVTVDGRTVAGVAQPRERARQSYEDAVDAGKTAVLHEEKLKGVHMLSVAHVPPGAEVVAEVSWTKALSFAGRGATLRVPCTVAQVYGRLPLLPSDDLVAGDDVFEATLTVEAEGGAVLAGHGIVGATATKVPMDAPIDLSFEDGPAATGESRGTGADGRAVTVAVGRAPGGELPLDVAIAMDISGSMDEPASQVREGVRATKWTVARDGLRQALASRLADRDRVALWQFDNDAQRVGEGEGTRCIGLLDALHVPRGGTNIDVALRDICRTGVRDVLLVTDGRSGAGLSQFAASGKRVSVLLVGANSLEANVGHLAALTGGDIVVAGGADVSDAFGALLDGLRMASSPATQATETALPDVLHERRGGAEVSVRRHGDAVADAAPDAVGCYAAALAMPLMTEEAATAAAVAHGLCTHLTSLVMVDEAGIGQEGVPSMRKVPLSRPFEHAFASAAPAGGSAMRSLMPSAMAKGGAPTLRASMASRSFMRALDKGATMDWAATSAPLGGTFASEDDVAIVRGPTSPRRRGPFDAVVPGAPPTPFREARVGPALRLSAVALVADWDGDANRLSRSDLSGLPRDSADMVRAAAALDVVAKVAASTGKDAVGLVIGLLARSVASSGNRAATRVARTLLAGVAGSDVDTMAMALGLAKA